MTLTHNNKPLPFGAMVTSESSQSSGIVADNGHTFNTETRVMTPTY